MATTTTTIDNNSSPDNETEVMPGNASTTIETHPIDSTPSLTAAQTSPTPAPSLRPSLSWKSVRSTLSVSEKTSAQIGWAVAFLSVLFTIVTLSPTFRSQATSERALKLAEWTALKDFIEECREELEAGVQSQACLRAIGASIPPPPYVKAGIFDRTKRGFLGGHSGLNSSRGLLNTHDPQVQIPRVIQNLLFLGIILTACVFFFLSFERSRSHIRRRSYSQTVFEKEQENLLPPTALDHDNEVVTSIQNYNHTSETVLRRRQVRTHPFYRHKTLGDAIQAEDLDEIRSRLGGGEDVNEHWPWLIYRLAINPKPSPQSLEVARLFLDFGADVNALKGWNGQSALMIAIHFGNLHVAKLLISNGAMVGYSLPDNNITALHRCVRLAVTGSSDDALEIMKMLFAHGAKVNQTDRLGETALHKLLIDSWYHRQHEETIMKLYPIALCLVENGASPPGTIKEKYVKGNPIWDLVYTAIWESDWPEHIGPDDRLTTAARKMNAAKVWDATPILVPTATAADKARLDNMTSEVTKTRARF